MIGMRTILEVADNSGARRLACIAPRGGDRNEGFAPRGGDFIERKPAFAKPAFAKPFAAKPGNGGKVFVPRDAPRRAAKPGGKFGRDD